MKGDIHEQIQSYLDNSMPPIERSDFEKRLSQADELKEELDLVVELESTLGNQELQKFRTKVKQIVDPEDKQEISPLKVVKDNRRNMRTWISIAASLLLIVGTVWFLSRANYNQDLADIATEYFVPYPANSQSRGSEIQTEIYNDYTNKAYDKAAPSLENFAKSNNDDDAKLFSAISYIGIQQASKSLLLLNEIKPTPSLTNKVHYYTGISHLMLNNKQEAIVAFTAVNKGDQFLYNKAQEILSKVQ